MKYSLIGLAIIVLVCAQAKATQYLRPNGTVSSGNFTAVGASSLHEALDETAQNGDTDHITSGRSTTNCEVNLDGTGIIDPQMTSGHVVRFWFQCVGGGNEAVTATLYEGINPIANSGGLSNNGGSYIEGTINLSGAEAGNIASYSALSVRFASSGCNKNGEEAKVTMVVMEIPDPPFSQPTIASPDVTLITDTTATFEADITSDGGVAITQHGTKWNDLGPPIDQNVSTLGPVSTGVFYEPVTGLTAGSLIYFRAYATNSQGTVHTSDFTFRTEPGVQASGVNFTSLGDSYMTINWTPGSGGSSLGSIVLVKENGAVDSPPVDGTEYLSPAAVFGTGDQIGSGNYVVYTGTGSSVAVTNLNPGSTYYVAVYAYAGSGTGIAGVNYIQTSPAAANQLVIGPPALTTVSSSNVLTTTGDLQVTVFSDGGGTITQHGTIWKNGSSPLPTDHPTTLGTYSGSVPGSFNDPVSELDASSQIYFQGYATNGDGTSYSDVGNFYTEPGTQATNVTITDVTDSSMQVNWTPGNGSGAIVIIKAGSLPDALPSDGTLYPSSSTFANPGAEIGTANYVIHSGSGSSAMVYTLTTAITYYVVVYEYMGSGPGQSGINYRLDSASSASQLIIGSPNLSTPTVSGADTDTATLGATVVNKGGAPSISARGTVWNTTGNPNIVDDAVRTLAEGGNQADAYTHSRDFTGYDGRTIYFKGYATNSFGTGYTPVKAFYTEPGTQVSNVNITRIEASGLRTSWTRGNGDGVIVLVKQGSAVDAIPSDGVEYNGGLFGNGSQIGSGNYVMYVGSGSNSRLSGLLPMTLYHIAVFEYNGRDSGTSGINYAEETPARLSETTVLGGHNAAHQIYGCTEECHNLHLTLKPTGIDQENACKSCHSPGNEAELMWNVDMHNGGAVDCGSCHEVHDSYNFDTLDTHSGGTTAPNTARIRWDTGKYVADSVEPALYQFDYTVNDKHLAFADGDERAGGGYDGLCQACHTNTKYHRNDVNGSPSGEAAARTHPQERGDYVGQPCIDCHPHGDGAGFSPLVVGGSCLDAGCHDGVVGSRRDVLADFGMTSHHVSNGSIIQSDCEVCHMENPPTLHSNGVPKVIDLRDPDTGNQIQYQGSDYSFSVLDRNTNSDVLEEWTTVVQNEFCFKCHDSDASRGPGLGGAAYLGANAMTPFSTGATVPEVYGKFDTASNTYHHAVRGPGSNPFTIPHSGYNTMMDPPWNQDTTGGPNSDGHDVISCFDCHTTNTHGSNNQRMLRTPIDFDTMISEAGSGRGGYSEHISGQVKDFCVLCHNTTAYATGSSASDTDGSAFQYHAPAQNGHLNSNDLACLGCHAGLVDDDKDSGLDNGAVAGNIHGGSFTWPVGSDSEFVITDTFVVGGWMSGWMPDGGSIDCWGGNCNHSNSPKSYPVRTP